MIEAHETPFAGSHKHQSTKTSSLSPITNGNLYTSILPADVFKIFFNKIHLLFSVDCGVALIYDEQITVIKEAYTSAFFSGNGHITANVITQPSALNSTQKTIADFQFPVLKTTDEWQSEEGENHLLIDPNTQYKYHCYIPLERNNKVLGTLELHNQINEFSAECLNFCSNIADFITEIIDRDAAILNSPVVSGLDSSLLDLKEKIDQINNSKQLDTFLNQAAALFPSAIHELRAQLDEISHYKARLENDSIQLPAGFEESGNYPDIVGTSAAMQKVFRLMDQVKDTDTTVLVSGETGTGKEMIARGIHKASARKNEPLIMVNCAAIPANLIESELFGHEKGAFTGAADKRIGKFELANNGTLFLDEIGEMPLDLQVKLLRVLQEKEIERVGGNKVIKTDVRMIAATNKYLLAAVQKGHFRSDLYFRLHVFPIVLPPLRERAEDLPLLAMHFVTRYALKFNKKLSGFTKGAIKKMQAYSWPGNVRELENIVERAVLLSQKPVISDVDLPVSELSLTGNNSRPAIKTIDENEREHILEVLILCNGKVSGVNGAARLLGVPATTLNSKIKRLGLNKKHF